MSENQGAPIIKTYNIKYNIRKVIGVLLLVGVGFTLCRFIRPPGPGFAPYLLIADVPNMPEASDTFDCKNPALLMFEYFTEKGYECQIITGNLELKNEDIMDSQHVWVLIKKTWGRCCLGI